MASIERGTNDNPETDVPVVFGVNRDAHNHAFRHTDACGLRRKHVAAAIAMDLAAKISWRPISSGELMRGIVLVDGRPLEYHAFVLSDGTLNVGRIVPHRPNRR